MGYDIPLPPPIRAVQATLSAIQLPEIHKYIQDHHSLICEQSVDGELPMLLTVVDLAQWTCVFEVGTDLNLALSRLKELSENLLVFVRTDSEDFEKAQK